MKTLICLWLLGSLAPLDAPSDPKEVVVRTVEGKVLRGSCDLTSSEGPLQLTTPSGTLNLPRERVVSITELSELRRTFRQMRRTAGADPARLFQVGHWASQQTLYEEMESCFEAVLEKEPFHAGVVQTLRALPLVATTTGDDPVRTARELVLRGARHLRQPVQVLILALQLERLSPDVYQPVLEQSLRSRGPDQRAFAARALYSLEPETSARSALLLAVLDRSDDVRRHATAILASRRDEQVLPTLRQALTSKHLPIRRNAMEVMAALRDPRAVPDLIARITYSGGTGQRVNISNLRQISYIRDFDVEVAQASSIADPVVDVLQEGSVLDVTLIGTHGTKDIRLERSTALRALRDITGERFGDVDAWEKWWAENGERAVRAYEEAHGIKPVKPTDQDDQTIR